VSAIALSSGPVLDYWYVPTSLSFPSLMSSSLKQMTACALFEN
jgi:hypothetical protein